MVCNSLRVLLVLLCTSVFNYAQSPPNITQNILWDDNPLIAGAQATYSDSTKTIAAFNNARRQEEINQGLTTHILGTLTLPSPWNILSGKDKVFYLINCERTCRAGIDYPNDSNPAVLGFPLDKQDSAMDTVAQNHADWLIANNLFQHTGLNSTTPFQRIQTRYPMNTCSEYLARGENIAIFFHSTNIIKLTVERSVYNWIYNDASSAWGHREAALLQNKDLQFNDSTAGYKDNFSAGNSEGMIGYGFGGTSGGTYWPTNLGPKPTWLNRSELIVMVVFDPVAAALAVSNNCSYAQTNANNVAIALPVVLEYFNAKKQANDILLNWSTISESNSKAFVVERSKDGLRYEKIGTIDANGNSNERLKYNFTDINPHNGLNYYRLTLEDWDGQTHIHKVAVVRNMTDLKVNIYPTIGKIDDFKYAVQAENEADITIQVIDSQGNIHFNETINVNSGGTTEQLNLPNLNSGIYFVNIASSSTFKTQKIVVE